MNPNKKQFLRLKEEWYEKLRASGFKDIETPSGLLKQQDRRTKAFDNRDMIQEFFINLEHYANTTPGIPKLHRRILKFYASGVYVKEIAKRVKLCRWSVHHIIRQYKRLFQI